ncbi:hypothetical protein HY213_01715 [Candidatus Peregrinibacteria bacterium]|nr:hypothetical protein [Candidatus Peregrinibacteria bacterium]
MLILYGRRLKIEKMKAKGYISSINGVGLNVMSPEELAWTCVRLHEFTIQLENYLEKMKENSPAISTKLTREAILRLLKDF